MKNSRMTDARTRQRHSLLSLPETKSLLRKAGFALSHSSKFDIILEYFIKRRSFNIFEINEVLFQYDMPLLGSGTNS